MRGRALRASWWLEAFYAVLGAAGAVALTLALRLNDRPFLLPMIAVLVAALRGGFGVGLVCAFTTVLLSDYFVLPPVGSLRVPSLAAAYELGVFAFTAGIITVLAARRRNTQLTLEATLGSIGDGVIVTDEIGRVTFINPVAVSLTGWSVAEAIGQPVQRIFNIVNEGSRTPVPNPVERALRDGILVALANHTILIARDGTERPISDSSAPIRDAQGRTLGAVLVFRDGSAHRGAERRLVQQAAERQELLERERSARAEAERANRLKDEFLATLSHELRTPLNAVLGWSHMLNRRQLTSGQQQQALAAIHRNAQAQARLVDDVLDLSRIVTGRMSLTAETVDLAEIVRTTAESFTPAVLGKRQDLRMQLSDAEVRGDPHRLRQIVWNLLSNATKFTPEGGLISCRVARSGDHVDLTVTDSGQGIAPDFLPFVFDRFRQADSSTTRGHGGLGLGLSLVRHLVEAHGGTVTASSDGMGRGATIQVTLPVGVQQDGSLTGLADSSGDELAGRLVLVLEDDEDARALVTVMLESLGATVQMCGSVEAALAALAARSFDFIVADLAIPGTDGFAFMREVRRREIQTPSLALTGYSDGQHRNEAYAAGFGGFITKPVTPENLRAALLALMQMA